MRIRTLTLAAVVLAAALAAGGCGGRAKYTHPYKDLAQEESDYSECDWEASKATGNVQKSGDRSERIDELIDKCMKAKGYRPK